MTATIENEDGTTRRKHNVIINNDNKLKKNYETQNLLLWKK